MKNYYEILGVKPNADSEVIKSAFRKSVKKWHPDCNPAPNASEKVRDIFEAYQILSNSGSRNQYDAVFNAIDNSVRYEDDKINEIIKNVYKNSEYFSEMSYEEVGLYMKIIFKRAPDIILTVIVIFIGTFLTIGGFFNESIFAIIMGVIIGMPLIIVGIRDIQILLKISEVKNKYSIIIRNR